VVPFLSEVGLDDYYDLLVTVVKLPQGGVILCVDRDNWIGVWEPGDPAFHELLPSASHVAVVGPGVLEQDSGRLRWWSSATGTWAWLPAPPLALDASFGVDAAALPDGRVVVVGNFRRVHLDPIRTAAKVAAVAVLGGLVALALWGWRRYKPTRVNLVATAFWWVFGVGALATLFGITSLANLAGVGSSEDVALIAYGVMGISGIEVGVVVMLIGCVGIRCTR
jgi:hypothetical protein